MAQLAPSSTPTSEAMALAVFLLLHASGFACASSVRSACVAFPCLDSGSTPFPRTGRSRLHHAAGFGRVSRLLVHLSRGASVDAGDVGGYSALFYAAREGHLGAVRALLAAGATNRAGVDGATPLSISCHLGNEACAKELIAAGAHVDDMGRGFTALFAAAQEGHVGIASALIAAGASVDLRSTDGFAPIFIAASENRPAVVKVLLAAGATPDNLTFERVSPLLVAAEEGNLEVCRMLLEAGANPTLRANDGWDPVSVAKKRSKHACLKLLTDRIEKDKKQGEKEKQGGKK